MVSFGTGNCYVFYRLLLIGLVYHSKKYDTQSRNSCTVLYSENGKRFCEHILSYVKVYQLCHCKEQCSCVSSYFAIVKQFAIDEKCHFFQ